MQVRKVSDPLERIRISLALSSSRFCDFDCHDTVKLNKHMSLNHPSHQFFCKTCDKMGKTKEILKAHIKATHFKYERS